MNKIKLNKLEENDLSKREMNQIRGGERVCSCGCAYAGEPGGSSTSDNGNAPIFILLKNDLYNSLNFKRDTIDSKYFIMKKVLIFITLLVFSFTLSAQIPYWRDSEKKIIIDTCRYSIVYRYKFYRDTSKKSVFFDKYVLEIGSRLCKYYSLNADKIDSVMFKAKKESRRGGISPHQVLGLHKDETATYEDYYKNYPSKGTLTVSAGILRELVYQESTPKMDWITIPGSDTVILGYPCLKAKLNFRGREYNAWFTVNIPFNEGPWKFNGLPGMILKVKELRGYFEWDIIGIKNSSSPIYSYLHENVRHQKCSRKEFLKFQRLVWEDPVGLASIFGREINKGGKPAKPGEIQFPPIPALELH